MISLPGLLPNWPFRRALKYLLENGQGIQTSKNKFKRRQLWDGEAADTCLYKQLIQNEKNKRKEEYSEPSEIIVVMEVMRSKHTFYRNIFFCHSFCETGQTKEVLVYFTDAFSPFPFLKSWPFLKHFLLKKV